MRRWRSRGTMLMMNRSWKLATVSTALMTRSRATSTPSNRKAKRKTKRLPRKTRWWMNWKTKTIVFRTS